MWGRGRCPQGLAGPSGSTRSAPARFPEGVDPISAPALLLGLLLLAQGESLDDRIWSARAAGDFAAAASWAAEKVAASEEGWAREAARRQQARLERAAALPELRRTEFAARLAALDSIYARDPSRDPEAIAAADRLARRWEADAEAFPYFASEAYYALAYTCALAGERLDRGEWAAQQDVACSRRALAPGDPALAVSLRMLGTLQHQQGRLAAAEASLREAWQLQAGALAPSDPEIANTLNTLAAVLHDQGTFADAEDLAAQVLAICRAGQDHLMGIPLNTLGSLRHSQGDLDQAETLFRESIAAQERVFGAGHWRVASPLSNLADVVAERGDWDEAVGLYRRALEIRRPAYGSAHTAVAILEDRLAEALDRVGEPRAAREHGERALRIYRDALGERHASTVGASVRHARRLLRHGDVATAEPLLRSAAEHYDAARARAATGDRRATVRIPSPWPELAALELRRGNEVAAWEHLERAHGRVLADLLTDMRTRTDAEQAALDELTRGESAIAAVQRTLRGSPDDPVAATLPELRAELRAAELEWSRVRSGQTEAADASAASLDLEAARAMLGAREVLIGWLELDTGLPSASVWAYTLDASDGLRWHRLPDASVPAEDRVSTARAELQAAALSALGPRRTRRLDDAVAGLHTERLAPWLDTLAPDAELLVVPSPATAAIPLEMLLSDEELARWPITYVPSASALHALRDRASSPAARVLLVADPPFSPAHLEDMRRETAATGSSPRADLLQRLPRLAWAREEARAVAAVLPHHELLLGPDASESRLQTQALRDFGVVHIATHARMDPVRPERSALILSQLEEGADAPDGRVTVAEILRGWDLDAELVVLSGCETAAGRATAYDGFLGFTQAFLRVGAKRVLASLWSVDDEATSILMRDFHAARVGGKSPAEALRDARLRLRGNPRFGHPFYWAAFVLVGEP